jgi:hypothetical protein
MKLAGAARWGSVKRGSSASGRKREGKVVKL